MWQRFTEHSRRVVYFAQEAAAQQGENNVSTEHLLLGVLHESSNVACRILDSAGVSRAALSAELERQLTRGEGRTDQEMQLTPRGKTVIDLAYAEARELGNHYIGAEHLLLGLVREEEGLAGRILRSQGAVIEQLRAEVKRLQDNETTAPSGSSPDSSSWSRFTERARRVIFFAQEAAAQLGQGALAPEHLLLGLLKENDTVAARILVRLNVPLTEIRSRVERLVARGDERLSTELGLTPRAKRIIDLTYDEVRQLGNHYVGTEHLLLGLIRYGDGIVGSVFAALGIELEKTRAEVRHLQNEELPAPSLPLPPIPPPLEHDSQVKAFFPLMEQESHRLNEHYASTEHILLALVRQPTAEVAHLLTALGVAPVRVLSEIERQVAPGSASEGVVVTLTPRAKRVFDLAYDEAKQLNATQLGLVHLLLGLIREREGLAGRILHKLGITLELAQQVARGTAVDSAKVSLSPDELLLHLRQIGQQLLTLSPDLKTLSPQELHEALFGDEAEEPLSES